MDNDINRSPAAARTVIGGTDVTDHIAKLVADWPPLTSAQRDRIAALMRPPSASALGEDPDFSALDEVLLP